MNPPVVNPPLAPSWRDVVAAEPARARPRTAMARRRVVIDSLRLWVGVVLLVASLAGGYQLWTLWRENPAELAVPGRSAVLREIVLRTDGVLDRAWVERTLAIAPGTGLMELDLAALRARLTASGQVRTAVLTRRFPDVLAVTLEERSPVLRLHAEDGRGGVVRLFVARDGTVFHGENYDEALVTSLPWLGGVALVRSSGGAGYAPVPGMEAVSELLGTVRTVAPGLARRFQMVSMGRYTSDQVVQVRMPEVAEVLFSTRDDYFRQLARLDYILEELSARPGGAAAPVRSINLAIGGHQVPVVFDESVRPGPGAGAVRAAPRAASDSSIRRPVLQL